MTLALLPDTPYLCRRHRFGNMNLLQLLSASGVMGVGNSGWLNSVSLFQYFLAQHLAALSIYLGGTGQSGILV